MVGEVEGGVGKASEDAVPFEHGCLPAAWPDVHEITVDVQLVPEEERRYKPILVSASSSWKGSVWWRGRRRVIHVLACSIT